MLFCFVVPFLYFRNQRVFYSIGNSQLSSSQVEVFSSERFRSFSYFRIEKQILMKNKRFFKFFKWFVDPKCLCVLNNSFKKYLFPWIRSSFCMHNFMIANL